MKEILSWINLNSQTFFGKFGIFFGKYGLIIKQNVKTLIKDEKIKRPLERIEKKSDYSYKWQIGKWNFSLD